MLDLDDLRGIGAQLLSGLGDAPGALHHPECGFSRFSGPGDSLLDDRSGQAVDLDIHLDGGDTLLGTSHLEVHVAEEIFQTLDIGQNNVIVVGLAGHQTAGDTGHHTP